MILPITDEYRIKTDEHNWTIQNLSGTRKNRQTGIKELNWKDVGYYPSLASAVLGLHQRMLRVCHANTLAKVLESNAHHLALITTVLTPDFKVSHVPHHIGKKGKKKRIPTIIKNGEKPPGQTVDKTKQVCLELAS